MKKILLFALLVFAGSELPAQTGMRDRYFTRYPFDQWQAAGEITQIRWSARVHPAKLSPHLRLVARIEMELDAREVAKRRGRGELATLLQVEDSQGKRWRAHDGFDLKSIPTGAKATPYTHVQDVFLLPGEYTVSLAICDSQTGEYNFTRRAVHVPAPRGDPLPSAWSDLPPVELLRNVDGPDGWFQPWIRGHVTLAVDSTRPVHIDVVMNMTASERRVGSVATFRRNMSVLVPALKILAGMQVPRGSLDVALLDLTRQRVWEQKDARGLDWTTMRSPLAENQPGVIDVQSLAVKDRMVQFFRDQVLARARPSGKDEARAVIVLSAPAFMGKQVRPDPVTYERDPGRKIFYLRYQPLPARPDINRFVWQQDSLPIMSSLPSDDLENALKPLDARVLTVQTPEGFRKALAAILAEIQRM